MKLRETQKEYKELIDKNNGEERKLVFATIKLPEILSGMDENDFRKIRQMKQQEFKNQLDKSAEKGDINPAKFHGMTDTEILINLENFKELGLVD